MTVDDDIRITQSQQQQQQQPQYLDFIEFCLADYNTDSFSSNNDTIQTTQQQQYGTVSSQLGDTRIKRKWAKSKIVDSSILSSYQTRLKDSFEVFQERLILFKIKEVNQYTTYIPLDVVFQNTETNSSFFSSKSRINYSLISMKKKLFIDMKTLKILNKNKQINWSSSLISLYPIKTLGDGNCLCHAVLSYLVGMQDINLALRDTLKNFMNDVEYTTELKYRWISYRKASDVAHAIQVDDKMLDIEWSEIINMKSAQQDHNESKNLSSSTLNSDFNSKAVSPSQSLIYLEDIHIFALANLLYRTIIVISLDTLRNIQPIHLRGIYLPLLRRPDECCKDPIVIAFHNFHFVPLLFPIDEENTDSSYEITSTEKYYHFDSVDELDSKELDTNDDFKYSPTSALLSKNSSTSTMMSASSGLLTTSNATVSAKRKATRFLNCLPLFYYNLEQMKIHFLKESEEKNSQSYLSKYLNLVEAKITIDDPQQFHRGYLNENQTLTVLCCYLHKDSRNKRVKHDGITTYLNFLNESIKKNGYKVVGSSNNYKTSSNYNNISNISDDSLAMLPSSPSRMTPAYTPSSTPIPVQIVPSEDPHRTITRCKSDYCSERVSDSSNYGYCSKCYKRNVQTPPATTPSPSAKKEIEAEKDAQQYQFVSTKATASPSYSLSGSSSPPTPTTDLVRRDETPSMFSDKETQLKTSAKLAEINKKIQNTTSVTRRPPACSSPQCNNLIHNYIDKYCVSCKESLIADATRSTPTPSNLRHQSIVNKQLDRVTSSRASSSKSSVQIPVKYETNITSSSSTNKISAYNLTSESKLYKPTSMLRSGIYEETLPSSYKLSNTPRVTSDSVYEEYDTSACGIIHDLRRPTRDAYGNYQSRNASFPFCSNCKYRQVDHSGVSSFCNSCRMNPYSKLYS